MQGEEPSPEWVRLVEALSNAHIKRALANIKDEYKHRKKSGLACYPPNVLDFEVMAIKQRSDDPKALPNPYEISSGIRGTARFYGVECEGKTEDEVSHLIWEAKHKL